MEAQGRGAADGLGAMPGAHWGIPARRL